MNRAAVKAKAQVMADTINEVFGDRVLFRSAEIRVALSSQNPGLALGAGGFRDGSGWRIRVPASVQPPPGFDAQGGRVKESFVEIATGRKFHVVTCVPASADSALAKEHIVEAELA